MGTGEGPEKFSICRPSFVLSGNLITVDETNGCSNEEVPADLHPECVALHQTLPLTKTTSNIITMEDESEVPCYPHNKGGGWCATCRDKAEKGEPGYCEHQDKKPQYSDYSYDSPNDVSHDKAWGYCDQHCFTTQPEELEEVSVYVLSKQECINRTYRTNNNKQTNSINRTSSVGEVNVTRPQVDRELCVAMRRVIKTEVYRRKQSAYIKTDTRETTVWGGSKSCQGDPGGALYSLDGDRAVLLGVAVRAEDCAGQNSTGIFARVMHHREWIQEHASQGRCGGKWGRLRINNMLI